MNIGKLSSKEQTEGNVNKLKADLRHGVMHFRSREFIFVTDYGRRVITIVYYPPL